MNSHFTIFKCSSAIIFCILIQAFFSFNYKSYLIIDEHFAEGGFWNPPPAATNQKLYCGVSHSLAIKSDSTLWAWGYNSDGQVGNGSTGNALYPVQVAGMTKAIDAAGGYAHTLALKSDGTVWAWGSNSGGQLGNGTLDEQTIPVQVEGLSNVVNVGAGYSHSFAIKSDKTLWAWGYNYSGQLGNGNTFNSVVASQVPALTGVVDGCCRRNWIFCSLKKRWYCLDLGRQRVWTVG